MISGADPHTTSVQAPAINTPEELFLRKLTLFFGVLGVFTAILGIVGTCFGITFISTLYAGYKTPALSATLAWIFFGFILAVHTVRPLKGVLKRAVETAIVAVAIVDLIEFPFNIEGSHFTLESWLVQAGAVLYGPASSHISPVAVALIIPVSVALFLYVHNTGSSPGRYREQDLTGIAGLCIVAVSFTYLLGYVYGAPLLYGTQYIPMSAISALAAFFIGAGLVTAAGPFAVPARFFTGDSVQACLLRTFIPLIIILIFIQNFLSVTLFAVWEIHNPLTLSVILVFFCIIVVFVIQRVSAGVGNSIDTLEKQRRAVEADLRKSERRYRTLFDNMLEGFAYCRMLYDENGNPFDFIYVSVNPAFDAIIGTSAVAGKKATEVFPGIRESSPELFEIYNRVAKTGRPESFDFNFAPSGKWLHISVYSHETRYFVAVFEDITERKKATECLGESERRYRDLFEINLAVMLLIDPATGRIVDANAAAVRYYGYSREEFGKLLITDINSADRDLVHENMSQAISGEGSVFYFRHRKKSGEIREVEVFSAPITLAGNRLLYSIVQDVTERRRAEDALNQANRKLNMLSSITRHDILNQIMGLRTFLELSKVREKDPVLLGYIIKEDEAAAAIAKQIEFTRYYQDIGVHTPVWQNAGQEIRASASHLGIEGIAVEINFTGLEVYADPLIEKVFYNLMENSLRHGGHVTRITLSFSETVDGGTIVYSDDGVGISAEDKEKLFTRGFGKHTGLGLFLSREILAITGITIREDGVPGEGVRFLIAIPKGGYRFVNDGQ